MADDHTSEPLEKIACPLCRENGGDTSGDNLVVHSDGHGYCHAEHGYLSPRRVADLTGHPVAADMAASASSGGGAMSMPAFGGGGAGGPVRGPAPRTAPDLLDDVRGFSGGHPGRALDVETLEMWGYGYGYLANGNVVHVAPYRNRERRVVAQKLRDADKSMPWFGAKKQVVPLWGWHLWKPGRRLVVTEGEIDAMSVSLVLNNRHPVVSLASGAEKGNALGDLKAAYWFLEQFEDVVLLFDNDEAGEAATEECCVSFTGAPFAVKVARLQGYKDPNEALQAGDFAAVKDAVQGAAEYRPQEIATLSELVDEAVERQDEKGEPYPWEGLNLVTGGAYRDTIVTLVSSSGGGKSTIARSWLLHFHQQTEARCGGIFLEERGSKTLLDFISMRRGVNLRKHRDALTSEEIREEAASLEAEKPIYLYNKSFALFDPDRLLSQIRYMALGLGCRYIALDHLSYIVGGIDTNDERKAIDLIMSKLRALVTETGVTLFLVVHLKRNDKDKALDAGERISKNHIRGSQSIEQISDQIFAAQRDKTDEAKRDYVELIVLKNRETGEERTACWLHYNRDTGALEEVPYPGELTGESSGGVAMPAMPAIPTKAAAAGDETTPQPSEDEGDVPPWEGEAGF